MKRKIIKYPVNAGTNISFLENKVKRLKEDLAACDNEDRCIDIQESLLDAENELRYAWADDESDYNYALSQQEFNPDGSLKYYGDTSDNQFWSNDVSSVDDVRSEVQKAIDAGTTYDDIDDYLNSLFESGKISDEEFIEIINWAETLL